MTVLAGRGSAAHVVVVGGGLAGITAALSCADSGLQVTLLESRPWLGGMTCSFHRRGLTVDNGQHVFLRCCTAYRELLVRLGVSDQVYLQDRLDIPVRTADGRRARLRRNGLPPPLHLAGALLRYRILTPAQRVRLARAALRLRSLDRDDPAVDRKSYQQWLLEQGQDPAAIAALWDLIGVATLNVRSGDASLATAAMVLQVGLLTDRGAADIGWPMVPLQRLHGEAAGRALAAAGVSVHVGAPVTAVIPGGTSGWSVHGRQDRMEADAVILAVPASVAARLAPPTVAEPIAACAALGTSPIINLHVIFDRTVLNGPFLAGVGTPIQWIFDRTRQSGLPAPGQYLAVSVSAADEYVDQPVAALRAELLPDLLSLLPRAKGASIVDFFVTRERHATFRPAPGSASLRPGAITPAAGLYLAGAWTDTGWPATMEGAVRSGLAAAAALSTRAAVEVSA
jgi:squalene-associated FAD-dependent desaturase